MTTAGSQGVLLFDTPIGRCGLAWTQAGLVRVGLPCADPARLEAAMRAALPGGHVAQSPPPARMVRVADRLREHLSGRLDALRDLRLDLSAVSPFSRRVYGALRKVGPGQVISYAELARRAKSPGAARAVGRAMASNPLPLVVPCHRVLAADRGLGGFSAEGGLAVKARLLFVEGVVLDERHAQGIELIRRTSRKLSRVVDRVGPYLARLGPGDEPYDTLVESIVYQQLSMKAAATIAGRLRDLGQGSGYPRPARLARLRDASLRKAGLSRQKISYLRDLAARVADGRLRPGALGRLSDQAVIETLCEVRGLGVWSAEMFLIFHLGRLDVWPVGDLGLRQAVARMTGLSADDRPAIDRWGERFRPYRSLATWYLWRSLEAGKTL